jgi:hypothetical protein
MIDVGAGIPGFSTRSRNVNIIYFMLHSTLSLLSEDRFWTYHLVYKLVVASRIM